MAQKCRDEGVSGILGQVLNIPVTCHPHLFPKDKYEFTSWEQNKDAAQLPAETMMWFWGMIAPISYVALKVKLVEKRLY